MYSIPDPRIEGKCYCTKPFYSKLIFKHLDYGILNQNRWHENDKIIALLAYLISLGRIIHENTVELPVKSMCEHTAALAAAEIVGSDILEIPDDENDPMTCAKARRIFTIAVHAILQNDGRYAITTSSDEMFEEYLIKTHVTVPDIQYHIISLLNKIMPFETAYVMALHLAECMLPPYEATYLQLLAYSYSTIVQNGNLTLAFCKETTRRILAELGCNVNLQLETMQIFYNIFCNLYVRQNSEHTSLRIFVNMPENTTTRLRLCVEKIDYPNLLSLNTIGRALRFFGNFKWDFAKSFYTNEWIAFEKDVMIVGNNTEPSHSIKIDPTSYMSLAWIAKELLVRICDEKILHWHTELPLYPDQFTLAAELLTDYDVNKQNMSYTLDDDIDRVVQMIALYYEVYN